MTGKEFTLKYEFKDVGELKDKESVYSPEEEHIGLNWRIRIQKFDERLNMFLHTNQTENQEVHVVSNAKILPKNKEQPDLRFFRSNIDWKTLENECLNDGKLEVEIHVKIRKMIGFPRKELRSFGEDMKQFSDVILKVENRKFYVSKLYLSSHSPYFATLFLGQFQESGKSEIELKDVSPEDMQFFLEVIYAEDAVDDSTVEKILRIADMYETPLAINKCEKYLINESKMELRKKLELAEKYRLEELKVGFE